MNTIDKRKKRLLAELKDREYRDAYVASEVDVGIAFQIRTLRKLRSWTQQELAEKANMKQERISALENPSNSPTLTTLKKLANVFDVGLVARFAPISELVEWELNLSPKSLSVMSYEDDPYFKEDINVEIDKYFVKGIKQIPIEETVININDWRIRIEIPRIEKVLDTRQQETTTELSKGKHSPLMEMAHGGVI